MSLPTWAEPIAQETAASQADFGPRLLQALTIAWNALVYYQAMNQDANDIAAEAMRRIEDLGK